MFILFSTMLGSRNQGYCGRPQQATCTPPQHSETVGVPHHAYTMHKQQHTNNWLAHQIQYNTVPVTQETRYQEHPATSACLPGPPRNPMPPPAVCSPPLHSEVVRIPHHIYTTHSQPTVRRWMTKTAGCNQYPVTQETQAQYHDTLDRCPPSSGGF